MPGVKDIIDYLYSRVLSWLRTASPGTLQLTGVLGFAVLVVGYYQIRGPANNNGRPRQPGTQEQQGQNARAAAQPNTPTQRSAPGSSSVTAATTAQPKPAVPGPGPGSTPEARAVYAYLAGTKRITVSLPGVLLKEATPAELQESASVVPEAVACVREMLRIADTYLLTQVVDDIGQAVVTGALEAAGLIGNGAGQIKPHRVLFCSTLEGKNSLVRQIEPELHIDSHGSTVEDLKRFLPQLLHVRGSSVLPSPSSAPNIGHASSLTAFFGL